MKAQILFLFAALGGSGLFTPAWARTVRYTLVLSDPPVTKFSARSRIETAQADVKQQLAARKIPVLGSVSGLLNAIFVMADEDAQAELSRLPGVIAVAEDRPYRRKMVKALEVHRAAEAWQAVGGPSGAGAGVKIAVLDTGIDHLHPAFQDPSLTMPAGFPRCRDRDCDFTNAKVIAARSYVDRLELGDVPEDSRPDDRSPRDRVGHGTAVAMVAAGVRHESPLGPMSGVAPRAFLGNYKIFGSPGVNDVTFASALIVALEDAVNDGMDIAVLSLGRPAEWLQTDRGTTCDLTGTLACDPFADAIENASGRILVVVAAGDTGSTVSDAPVRFNSVESPAVAPSALAVGAITNAQTYRIPVRIAGDAPAAIQTFDAVFGDGPRPETSLRAPLRDAAAIQEEGLACAALPANSLAGSIAIVQRGTGQCAFATKIVNAQKAGAAAVLIEQTSGTERLFPMSGLGETGIPAALIGSQSGQALREFLRSNPGREATIAAFPEARATEPDAVAYFSARGPSINSGAIKPEVAAVGDSLYMATQKYDPNGELYSPNGFTAAQGTSFAAPIAAGAAALFKQRFPSATPAQMKSAVVNTATELSAAGIHAAGAGKVNLPGAATTTLTVREATISFGILARATTFPQTRTLNIMNHAAAPAAVRLAAGASGTTTARVALAETTFTLAAGATRQVAVRLEGATPTAAGIYSGSVTISGGATELRVPFSFLVGDGIPYSLVPLNGAGFNGEASKAVRLSFKAVDRFGVPVGNAPVVWRGELIRGGAIIERVAPGTPQDPRTDAIGIHEARVILGNQPVEQELVAGVNDLRLSFLGRAKLAPRISTGGVVNTASSEIGRGLAPGSYISIYGQALSGVFKLASTPYLPLSLAGVSVSFDVAGGRSYAGRLSFVSENQINVQIPWELQGLTGARMKVSIGDISGPLYTLALNDYSPAIFEVPDPTGATTVAALDTAYRLINTANPLVRGQAGQLYCNGLGPVSDQPASGEATPLDPLPRSRIVPTVTIGGRPAQVLFSGLAPYFVGLYQINLVPATDTPTGLQPVVITVNGVASKSVDIAIR